ncbi:MAG: methylmalonyl Co-A mutase-associated GTPase MeaB [Bacteroidia bacterium]
MPQQRKEIISKIKEHSSKLLTAGDYFNGIKKGDVSVLGQAITLIESSLEKHRTIAETLIEKCLLISGKSIRIGITGVPGVGKSTFIEAWGNYLTSQGHKVAVLAIDPSSQSSKGSILGDKTRMNDLAINPKAFIRPSPSAGSLGGVAQKTRESIILCEAAGFDIILIETVGVGQSETVVHSMTDFFLLLMLSGAGDELQGIKRGIMEMADHLTITKADGDNLKKAKLAAAEYKNALHLFPAQESGWVPQVSICSSIEKTGLDTIWQTIESYKNTTVLNGYFDRKRQLQTEYWMNESIKEQLLKNFHKNKAVNTYLENIKKDLHSGKISPFKAAEECLKKYFN